jgi:hypothetical protein
MCMCACVCACAWVCLVLFRLPFLLPVQSYAARQKWSYTTLGQFKNSLHFIVSLPSDTMLTEFLTSTMERLLKQAGFASWSFPEGCSEPDVNFNVERYLSFDRKYVASSPTPPLTPLHAMRGCLHAPDAC